MIWAIIYLLGVIVSIAIMIFDDQDTLPEDVLLLSAVWPVLALLGLVACAAWAWDRVERWRAWR